MNEKTEFAKVKVLRFDPMVDKKLRYEVYQIPSEGYTVLNALRYIYEHYDRTLAYRVGCLGKGSGRCGVCQILVNGVPCLSCQRAVEDNITLEPHPKFELVKDLVVDFNRVRQDRYKGQAIVQITMIPPLLHF